MNVYTVFMLCWAAVLVTSAPISKSNKTPKGSRIVDTKEKEIGFLSQYHYMGPNSPNATLRKMSIEDPERALRIAVLEYQKRYNLNMTGVVDENTRTLMEKARCGFPDVTKDDYVGHNRSARRYRRFVIESDLDPDWVNKPGRLYTYRLINTTPDLPDSLTRVIIQQSFNAWSQHAPITFIPSTSDTVDILIMFGSYTHTDDPYDGPFDGSGGVLAHAFTPQPFLGIYQGDAHFDESETWTYQADGYGFDLFQVAVHEFGHSMGILHSSNLNAIMYPTYDYFDHELLFTQGLYEDDINAIQYIYGEGGGNGQGPTIDFCTVTTFDAMVTIDSQLIYAFNGRWYSVLNRNGVIDSYTRSISESFGAEFADGIDEALYLPEVRTLYADQREIIQEKVYFFKGNYAYTMSGLDKENNEYLTKKTFSEEFGNMPTISQIRAAVYTTREEFYLITQDYIYRIRRYPDGNKLVDSASLINRRQNKVEWRLPYNVYLDAGLTMTDNYGIYIFLYYGSEYYRVNYIDNIQGEIQVWERATDLHRGDSYPRNIVSLWLPNCLSAFRDSKNNVNGGENMNKEFELLNSTVVPVEYAHQVDEVVVFNVAYIHSTGTTKNTMYIISLFVFLYNVIIG